jgi:carbamoyltransferase
MNILGYHGVIQRAEQERRVGQGGHDAAAALIRGGHLVAAFEEERLNRLKHANCLPIRAIRACLDRGGLSSLDQIDRIAVGVDEEWLDRTARVEALSDLTGRKPGNARSRVAASLSHLADRDLSAKVSFCPHHIAHAWSAFVPSGFEESLVFIADGRGEELSGSVLLARGRELTTLRTYSVAKSLGQFYTATIALLGYDRFDEYKVMGLAPYGDPSVYASLFEEGCRLLPDGDYDLDPAEKWVPRLERSGLLAQMRRKGQPFARAHMDLAAALQQTIERIVLHVLSHYRGATGQRHLCMAGGVAHNCSANGRVLYANLFDHVFVQPAAHDAGNAYGAAVHAAYEAGVELRDRRWTHVFLGTDVRSERGVAPILERWTPFLTSEHIGDSPEVPARLLAEGAVIGWVQGRAEFGPRALGNRSILADPRPAENKTRINAMVKKREAYRPFAPSVLVERVHDYFDLPGGQRELPFMLFVVQVKAGMRDRLGAITHIDGTARVQTVAREDNPRFWSLIRAFERETGVGMLLNTSFNNHAEPIVDTADDAIACFLTTGLDYLVIDDYLVRKRADAPLSCYGGLAPCLTAHRRLVRGPRPGPDGCEHEAFTLESTRSEVFGPMNVSISKEMFGVLSLADGSATLSELVERAALESASMSELPEVGQQLYQEAIALWTGRLITLRPAAQAGADEEAAPVGAAHEAL